jgi:hypothetical protein
MRSILLAYVFILTATVALAQGKMNCTKTYLDTIEKFFGSLHKISPEELAGINRMALRAYDACQAGDDQDAKALFERLAKMAEARKDGS